MLHCGDLYAGLESSRPDSLYSWYAVLSGLCVCMFSGTPEYMSLSDSLSLFPSGLWLSLLYKRLIGPKVLAVHVAGLSGSPGQAE